MEEAFKKANLTFCNVDYPGLKTNFMITSSIFYLRLHGNPELFKSSYPEHTLQNFYERFPIGCKSYIIFFNNTYYEAGYTNALRLKEICK